DRLLIDMLYDAILMTWYAVIIDVTYSESQTSSQDAC
ncbi:hypothetical protein Tco_0942649, partial [Tanacetum coccineum]